MFEDNSKKKSKIKKKKKEGDKMFHTNVSHCNKTASVNIRRHESYRKCEVLLLLYVC